MNDQQTALVNCVGITAAIGVSKIEPSERPNNNSSNARNAETRHARNQKYTNLRRERLKPASVISSQVSSLSLPLPAKKQSTTKITPPKSTTTTTTAIAKAGSNFESYTISRQLDKKQRFDVFMRRLAMKPGVSNSEQAIQLLNNTMVEVEDRYAPKKCNKFYAHNSKRYGRMHPIPNDRIKLNAETGVTELLSVGLITYIQPNGYFEMWTVPRGRVTEPKRIFKKNAIPVPIQTQSEAGHIQVHVHVDDENEEKINTNQNNNNEI